MSSDATEQITFYRSNTQFDKLLEITTKCVDYYNKFVEEKNLRMSILQSSFTEIKNRIENSFKFVMSETTKKKNTLEQFLRRKHKQLVREKQRDEQELKTELEAIKSIHLTNLLKEDSVSDELSSYAGTLNKFYSVMEKIEENCFEESASECMDFINHLLQEEIKGLLKESSFVQQTFHQDTAAFQLYHPMQRKDSIQGEEEYRVLRDIQNNRNQEKNKNIRKIIGKNKGQPCKLKKKEEVTRIFTQQEKKNQEQQIRNNKELKNKKDKDQQDKKNKEQEIREKYKQQCRKDKEQQDKKNKEQLMKKIKEKQMEREIKIKQIKMQMTKKQVVNI